MTTDDDDEPYFPDRRSEPLRLDTFLKLCGIADTGGFAKRLIQDGYVEVNGEVETRRRRKLSVGDVVRFEDHEFLPDEYLPSEQDQAEA